MATPVSTIPTPAPVNPATGNAVAARSGLERAARIIRNAVDAVSLVLLAYGAIFGKGSWGSITSFWLMSLGIFPRPRVAEQLRRRPEAALGLFLVGLAIIGYALFHPLLGDAPFWRNAGVFDGLMLVLAGASVNRYVKTPPGEEMSIGRLLLGISALASGAVWVYLSIGAGRC